MIVELINWIIMIKYIRDSNEKNINKNNKKISTNTIQIS